MASTSLYSIMKIRTLSAGNVGVCDLESVHAVIAIHIDCHYINPPYPLTLLKLIEVVSVSPHNMSLFAWALQAMVLLSSRWSHCAQSTESRYSDGLEDASGNP